MRMGKNKEVKFEMESGLETRRSESNVEEAGEPAFITMHAKDQGEEEEEEEEE